MNFFFGGTNFGNGMEQLVFNRPFASRRGLNLVNRDRRAQQASDVVNMLWTSMRWMAVLKGFVRLV